MEHIALRPEVAKAIQTAKENLPPASDELLRELGAYTGDSRLWSQQGKPVFSGWIWLVGGFPWGVNPGDVDQSLQEGYDPPTDFDLSDIGYHGFWKGRVAGKIEPFIWCSLPSLQYGRCNFGSSITIGEEKIRLGYSPDETNQLLWDGYGIIMKMIAKYGEY